MHPLVNPTRFAYTLYSFQGFTCQGNEFSHFMLLSSYFILNKLVFFGPANKRLVLIISFTLEPTESINIPYTLIYIPSPTCHQKLLSSDP